MFSDTGKYIVATGLFIVVAGLLVWLQDKTGVLQWFKWFGNLPFDIKIERENFRLYFPVGSMVLLSALLSLILHLFKTFMR